MSAPANPLELAARQWVDAEIYLANTKHEQKGESDSSKNALAYAANQKKEAEQRFHALAFDLGSGRSARLTEASLDSLADSVHELTQQGLVAYQAYGRAEAGNSANLEQARDIAHRWASFAQKIEDTLRGM